MLKEQLGLMPTSVGGNIYTPSEGTLRVMVRPKASYEKQDYPQKYTGKQKLLVICTEENHLECKNGKILLTGNHPVETFGVLRQLTDAGIDHEVATPTGKQVKFEEWAYPSDDPDFMAYVKSQMLKYEALMKMADALKKTKDGAYLGVYVPGPRRFWRRLRASRIALFCLKVTPWRPSLIQWINNCLALGTCQARCLGILANAWRRSVWTS